MRTTLDDVGSIYFANAAGSGLTKIGFATNVKDRLYALNVGSPVLVKMVGRIPATRGAEKALHAVLAAHRVKGEWYPETFAFGVYDDLGEIVADVGVSQWDEVSWDSYGTALDEAVVTAVHIEAERAMLSNADWLQEA